MQREGPDAENAAASLAVARRRRIAVGLPNDDLDHLLTARRSGQ
jgi:hypothetical protein